MTCLAAALAALALAGCGSSDSSQDEASARGSGYVDWPVLGRVPERAHYLPAHKRVLDPPLRQAWSINTHALTMSAAARGTSSWTRPATPRSSPTAAGST